MYFVVIEVRCQYSRQVLHYTRRGKPTNQIQEAIRRLERQRRLGEKGKIINERNETVLTSEALGKRIVSEGCTFKTPQGWGFYFLVNGKAKHCKLRFPSEAAAIHGMKAAMIETILRGN